MDLLKDFQNYIYKEKLFEKSNRLLLAVSGGVDSIVLCALCKLSGFDFAIAHCNFKLRGAESDTDEVFVRQLAEQYNVDFFVKEFNTGEYAVCNKLSIQVAARNLRYNWFRELMADESNALNHLLTAHHANDNIETLLMNFFKGTGIAGLQGIHSKSNAMENLVRPLLFARKTELADYAMAAQLSYREDSSNSSNKYTRNYFRNELIPALQQIYPQVEQNLQANIERFKEVEILYQQAVSYCRKKLLFPKGREIHIPVLKLKKTAALSTIVFEISRKFGFTASQVPDIIKLLDSSPGKYVSSPTHRIIQNRAWLIIVALEDKAANHFLLNEVDNYVLFTDKKMRVEKLPAPEKIDQGTQVAQLDASKINFPLILRKGKKGDYFYPLGMEKKKKLSRFLVDMKLSLTEKEQLWVIEMNKKIIWVVGQRIDNRFKITAQTKSTLRLSVSDI